MKKIFGVVVAVVMIASAAWSQQMPKSEILGGYTFQSADQGSGNGRLNQNGWHTGIAASVNQWLSVEGNIAGLSHSESASFTSGTQTFSGTASEKNYTFVFGPRFNFGKSSKVTPFVHTLFGLDRMSVSDSGNNNGTPYSASASETAFATALGGGMEFPLSKSLAMNTGFDYLMTRHASATQNNIRIQVGIAYRFDWGLGKKS
jgi:opacity protein-like surface antigen